MSRLVTCINKQDRYSPNERISHIGGSWGKVTESSAIVEIKINPNAYHVNKNGRDVRVIIDKHEGREYLKTENDGVKENNLLSLKECL